MARPSKRNAKPATGPKATSNQRQSSTPPAPYNVPPPVLEPFLETLDPSHIYIWHIDKHPWRFKRRIFTVPVLMNVAIVILLLWRAYIAIPSYFAILVATLGYDSPEKVDTNNSDMGDLVSMGMKRTFMFFVDFSLVSLISPWPVDFFLGIPANPTAWRRLVGFQDKEIVIRQSRKWDSRLPKDWMEKDGTDHAVYQERIMPAINPTWVAQKTGYLMMDKSWDLSFQGMIDAHFLLDQKRATLDDFQKTVVVHSETWGWLVWNVYKLDEGSQEEGRKHIVAFKDKLTAMGKENLFFKWIELVQYEASQPGGFTPERQEDVAKKAHELFASQGVDFEEFRKDVEGLPGMTSA